MKQNLLLKLWDDTKSRGAVNALIVRPDIQRILNKLKRRTNKPHEQRETRKEWTPRLMSFCKLSFASFEGCNSSRVNGPRERAVHFRLWNERWLHGTSGTSHTTAKVWYQHQISLGTQTEISQRKTVWYHNLFPLCTSLSTRIQVC